MVNGNESILQSMAGAQGVRCARHALHTGWQPDRRPGSEMMMADFMWPYYISCGLITCAIVTVCMWSVVQVEL